MSNRTFAIAVIVLYVGLCVLLAIVFISRGHEQRSADAKRPDLSSTLYDIRSGTLEQTTLPDGTRCVVYSYRAITCDFKETP